MLHCGQIVIKYSPAVSLVCTTNIYLNGIFIYYSSLVQLPNTNRHTTFNPESKGVDIYGRIVRDRILMLILLVVLTLVSCPCYATEPQEMRISQKYRFGKGQFSRFNVLCMNGGCQIGIWRRFAHLSVASAGELTTTNWKHYKQERILAQNQTLPTIYVIYFLEK